MHEPVEASENSRRAYESSEVSVRQLFAFAVGVVALVVAGVLGSALVFRFFVRHTSMGPSASPFEDVRTMPPGPRLATAAPVDLKSYRANQDKILAGYGWVDPHAGVVRIPIERAMDLMLQKGYPGRGAAAPKGSVNTPGEPSPPGSVLAAPTPVDGEAN